MRTLGTKQRAVIFGVMGSCSTRCTKKKGPEWMPGGRLELPDDGETRTLKADLGNTVFNNYEKMYREKLQDVPAPSQVEAHACS
jgi:hypothetical protein